MKSETTSKKTSITEMKVDHAARAAQKTDKQVHEVLRLNNLLTCDARKKERKKYGLKKARRASQFSKR